MFEAKIADSAHFRKTIDAIKDLVKNANLDVTPQGMSLQAMDSSHVALVSLNLKQMGFSQYRCDKCFTLGVSVENLPKILKCASHSDLITLHCEDQPNTLGLTVQSTDRTKLSEFSLTLIRMEAEQIGIPDDSFTSECTLPAHQFARVCKELGGIADSITITAKAGFIEFSVSGSLGSGKTIFTANTSEKEQERVALKVSA